MPAPRTIFYVALMFLVPLLLTACSAPPAAAPTATSVAIAQSTATSTQPAATSTSVPPTATPRPAAPTATIAPTPTPRAIPSPTVAPPTTGKVGDRTEGYGMALTVVTTSKTGEKLGFSQPKPDHIFLVAEVVIESIANDDASYNPLFFRVRDSDGFEYRAQAVGPEPGLRSGKMSRGEKVRGNVAFEVKNTATGLTLIMEAGGNSSRLIRVNLGQ